METTTTTCPTRPRLRKTSLSPAQRALILGLLFVFLVLSIVPPGLRLVGRQAAEAAEPAATATLATGTQDEVVDAAGAPGPGRDDHWHSAYGVYDCTLDGVGGVLSPFTSTRDDVGIHSHSDGVIHIHPFFEESSGGNAQMQHFFTAMDITVTDHEVVLDSGRRLTEGTECADGSGPAELRLYRWATADEATIGGSPTSVVTDSFGDVRFLADNEAFMLVFAGEGAPTPMVPQARFGPAETFSPSVPSVLEEALSNPPCGIDVTPPILLDRAGAPVIGDDGLPAIDLEAVEASGMRVLTEDEVAALPFDFPEGRGPVIEHRGSC